MANQKHLDFLKQQGVEAWNAWRVQHADFQPDLRGAHLSGAQVGGTIFAAAHLSVVKGIETVILNGHSTIGIDTIYLSKDNIPEIFLKGAGVDDTFITFLHSLP